MLILCARIYIYVAKWEPGKRAVKNEEKIGRQLLKMHHSSELRCCCVAFFALLVHNNELFVFNIWIRTTHSWCIRTLAPCVVPQQPLTLWLFIHIDFSVLVGVFLRFPLSSRHAYFFNEIDCTCVIYDLKWKNLKQRTKNYFTVNDRILFSTVIL